MGYKRERHEWEIEIQEQYALDIYKQIWPNCEIKEIDKEGINDNFKKELDFSGIDKIIKINRLSTLHLAQRFRKPRINNQSTDFSFRYVTLGLNDKSEQSSTWIKCPYYTPWCSRHCNISLNSNTILQRAEYFMLLEAYKNDYNYPKKYVFGETKGKEVNCGGFKQFYIFDLSPILEAIINKNLHPIGIYPNRDDNGKFDGTCGIYYKIEDLKPFIYFQLHKEIPEDNSIYPEKEYKSPLDIELLSAKSREELSDFYKQQPLTRFM